MAVDKTLKRHAKITRNKQPVLVCILDGWGENVAKDKYNAIHSAKTPVTGLPSWLPLKLRYLYRCDLLPTAWSTSICHIIYWCLLPAAVAD
jgi:hypothetical protein